MKIDNSGGWPLQPDIPRKTTGDQARARPLGPRPSPQRRQDSVEISTHGRRRLEDGPDEMTRNDLEPIPSNASDRMDQVRRRIESGAYDAPEVQQQLARRIQKSGDLYER